MVFKVFLLKSLSLSVILTFFIFFLTSLEIHSMPRAAFQKEAELYMHGEVWFMRRQYTLLLVLCYVE